MTSTCLTASSVDDESTSCMEFLDLLACGRIQGGCYQSSHYRTGRDTVSLRHDYMHYFGDISFHLDIIMDGTAMPYSAGAHVLNTHASSYLFDIFLGPSYNQTPPSVKYMTVCITLCFLREIILTDVTIRRMEGNSVSIQISMQCVSRSYGAVES